MLCDFKVEMENSRQRRRTPVSRPQHLPEQCSRGLQTSSSGSLLDDPSRHASRDFLRFQLDEERYSKGHGHQPYHSVGRFVSKYQHGGADNDHDSDPGISHATNPDINTIEFTNASYLDCAGLSNTKCLTPWTSHLLVDGNDLPEGVPPARSPIWLSHSHSHTQAAWSKKFNPARDCGSQSHLDLVFGRRLAVWEWMVPLPPKSEPTVESGRSRTADKCGNS